VAELTAIVIPTYNESETIPAVLAGIAERFPEFGIFVVDDNSPDGTGKIADEFAHTHKNLRVIHRAQKQGIGPAYIEGFRAAIDSGAVRIVAMDADGSHRLEDLERMLKLSSKEQPTPFANSSQNPGLVIGSRWIPGGEVTNWNKFRRLLSRTANRYAKFALRSKVRDLTSGFRIYSAEGLERLDFARIASQGYCFQIETAWQLERADLSILEVPIVFVERTSGKSKMSFRIALEAVLRITAWALTRPAKLLVNNYNQSSKG